MTDLHTRIAAVLLTHRHVGGKCLCQSLRETSTSGEHARHVADMVMDAITESATECWDLWPARRCVILGTVDE